MSFHCLITSRNRAKNVLANLVHICNLGSSSRARSLRANKFYLTTQGCMYIICI